MRNRLLFATGNAHKVEEVRQILEGTDFPTIHTPREVGINADSFPETSDTIEGNAREKAAALFDLCHENCFAEDTGLEVDALNGAPGVYTARYAGPGCTAQDNINKLLNALDGQGERTARFRTVIALHWQGAVEIFAGVIEGRIAESARGTEGFGYDPVFIPEGFDKTFAELSSEIKNTLSHRARAVAKLRAYILAHPQR